MSHYISSITTNYGDIQNLKQDVVTLHDIIARQGSRLLIDIIAEQAGVLSIRFKLNETERQDLIKSLLKELDESLSERI